MKQVKAISTKRFMVRLLEMESGEYRVEWLTQNERLYGDEQPHISEAMDLKTATHLFDMKLAELEGN